MRIRTIKPEFWSHPVLGKQPDEVRLGSLGLLNYADDEGYFLAEPAAVRSALWPFDDDSLKARRVLARLSALEFIQVVEHPVQGKIGLIVNFRKHQRIDRPSPSKLKLYYSTNARRTLDEHSLLEQGTGNRDQGNKGTGIPAVAAPVADAPADGQNTAQNTAPNPEPPAPAVGAVTNAAWIASWFANFKARFGADYAMDGGRDGKAVKKLLKFTDALDVAKQAWDRDGFACKQAITIHGLADFWNQIRAELSGKAAQPAWKEKQVLQLAIKRHKANPAWVQYDPRNVTDADKADLERMEKRLAELEAQA